MAMNCCRLDRILYRDMASFISASLSLQKMRCITLPARDVATLATLEAKGESRERAKGEGRGDMRAREREAFEREGEERETLRTDHAEMQLLLDVAALHAKRVEEVKEVLELRSAFPRDPTRLGRARFVGEMNAAALDLEQVSLVVEGARAHQELRHRGRHCVFAMIEETRPCRANDTTTIQKNTATTKKTEASRSRRIR